MESAATVSSREWNIRLSMTFLCLAGLAGCAARDIQIRSLPPQTPAGDEAAAAETPAELARTVAGTLAGEMANTGAAAGAPAPPLLSPADAPSMFTYDPFGRLNRFTYRFNARFDETVLLHITNG